MSAGFAFRRRNGLVSSAVLLNVLLASTAHATEADTPAAKADEDGGSQTLVKTAPARPAPKHGPLASLVPSPLAFEGRAPLAFVGADALRPSPLARGATAHAPQIVTESIAQAERLQARPAPAQPDPADPAPPSPAAPAPAPEAPPAAEPPAGQAPPAAAAPAAAPEAPAPDAPAPAPAPADDPAAAPPAEREVPPVAGDAVDEAAAFDEPAPGAEPYVGPEEEEVVRVTIDRREKDPQDFSGSVDVFTESDLERKRVTSMRELTAVTPYVEVGAAEGNIEIYMRGIGNNNNTEIGDPAAAVHIDGVYIPRPRGLGSMFFDVERIEVSRGPQGTLRGRDATAGTMNIVSAAPKLG